MYATDAGENGGEGRIAAASDELARVPSDSTICHCESLWFGIVHSRAHLVLFRCSRSDFAFPPSAMTGRAAMGALGALLFVSSIMAANGALQ